MVLTRGSAVVLLLLGVLPFAQWIPAGLSDPGYSRRWLEWGYGAAICVGVGIVASIIARNFAWPVAVPSARVSGIRDGLQRAPVRTDIAIAIACGIVYIGIARTVFDGKPLLIDELVQVFQARMYAGGHLFTPVDQSREFFSVLHMVDIGDRFYSQFPPGWPVMLAVGTILHAEWIVGPVCGALSVFVFARLLRRIYGNEAPLTVMIGSLVFGLGPFAAFQFSSHMSHGPVLMWILMATLALTRVLSPARSPGDGAARWAFLAGVCAGCAFAVRPLDAVAYAVPAAAWMFWRAWKDARLRPAVFAVTIGLVIPVIFVMWVNVRTTGSPTEFGYEALWGPSHGLGFHAAPWGDPHTPQRGIELLSLYVTRLNVYLFETPFPSLFPIIIALVLAESLTAVERYLLIATGLHGLLYFAYWHDGFYLGPRFVTPWIPILVLLAVRCGRLMLRNRIPGAIRSGLVGFLCAAVVIVVAIGVPVRAAQYRAGLASMRPDYGSAAAAAGVTNALVFVRESWGAELVARLWAMGVSRNAAAALYSRVDACVLDHAIRRVELAGTRGGEAEETLRPLMQDSLQVRPSNVSPDSTERMLPGTIYDSTCTARVVADREGYALYPPFLLDHTSGNVYARDIPGRDSILIRRYKGRHAYMVRRDGVDGASPLRWIPLTSDGLVSTLPAPDRLRVNKGVNHATLLR